MEAKKTRFESYIKTLVERPTRHKQILDVWPDGPATAREIAIKLHFPDMDSVRPRITELVHKGALVEAGQKYDILTNRNVTCWRKVK